MASMGMVLRTAILSFLVAYYFPGLYRWVKVLGIFRHIENIAVSESDWVAIEDTVHCEDLHRHGDWLYAACEDNESTRFSWFPPLESFNLVPPENSQGSIHVVDVKTFKSKRLQFEGFTGAFFTHGIDVVADPARDDAVYVFAVNHLPNPEYVKAKEEEKNGKEIPKDIEKARSQIEVFHHVLGSSTITWIRSLWHPLIRTPNDIIAVNPSSVYVTNDHYYREGFLRSIEDAYFGAKWSDIVHIEIDDISKNQKNSSAGIDVSIAHTGLQNNNGLGRGRNPNEIIIGSAVSGTLHLAELTGDKAHPIRVKESIPVDSSIDNPFYYQDPYPSREDKAEANGGFLLPGLARAVDFLRTARDPNATNPVLVWYVRPAEIVDGKTTKWKKEVIFQDDGSKVRTASGAVLLPIDPEREGGKKKVWVVVAGLMAKSIVAVKVEISPEGWEGNPPDEL